MKKYPLIISSIVLVAIISRLICFVGLIGSDDLNYNDEAYEISTGTFSPVLSHHETRVGLFLPVAVLFKIFGVSEFSSVAYPFFCALLTLGVILYAGTTYLGKWGGIIAGLLYALLPIEMFYATQLMPDLPASACIALSSLLCYRWYFTDPGHNSETQRLRGYRYTMLLLAGLLLGWAYLIKETSVFFAIFIAGYMCYAAWFRKIRSRGWMIYCLGFLLVIGGEFTYYYVSTGTPFFRYLSVDSGHNSSVYSGIYFHQLPFTRQLQRIFLDLPLLLSHVQDFSFYYFFIFAGIVYGIRKRPHYIAYTMGWFLTLALLFNFASTSFTNYSPLLLFPRFFILLSVPGILIMTWYLQTGLAHFLQIDSYSKMKLLRRSLLIPFVPGVLINFIRFSGVMTLFLCFIGILIMLSFSEPLRRRCSKSIPSQYVSVISLVVVLYITLLPGIYTVAKGESPLNWLPYEREIFSLLETPLSATIYTDHRTARILEYFYRYRYDDQIRSFEEIEVKNREDAYVIVNWARLLFLQQRYNFPIPDFLYQTPSHWKLRIRFGDEQAPCIIYTIE